MKRLLFIIGIIAALSFSSCGDGKTYAEIETEFGTMKVLLYDETPKHKANFIKLANEGFYDDLLFHRVMKNFMVQGGDPNSRDAKPGIQLGGGGPGYLVDAEIGFPHFRGALAAARTGGASNPDKKSSGSQFYVVQGQPQTDSSLERFEKMKNFKYAQAQKDLYKEVGGRPDLDMEYTVFGEVVSGIEVVDKITENKTDRSNRPLEDIKMKVRIIN